MKYTFRKIAGMLCIALAAIVLARFVPAGIWYFAIALLTAAIVYFLYVCFYQ